MKTVYRSVGLLLLIAAFVVVPTRVGAEKQKLRFTVALAPTLSSEPVSGRLIVFMTKNSEPLQIIEPSLFDLTKVWVAAMEVRNFTPGKSIELDADDIASPAPLSTAPAGDYQLMALLDVDHSYSYLVERGPPHPIRSTFGVSAVSISQNIPRTTSIVDQETSHVIFFASKETKFFRGRSLFVTHASLVNMADR